ncbi:iron-sulfur cluster-binding protein [Syntrophaceticus schinkii]
MACGVGACVGCVCQGADGSYLRVCHEGPVFEAREVVLGG